MIFIKNTNFSREETVGSYISSQIKDVVEPIETIEKNKATVYGGLGGAAIGALLGGAGTMLSRGKDKKKNKKALRNALIGAGIGGIGGALGLRYLQGRKFENVADQGRDWLEKMAPVGLSKIEDPQNRSEMETQVKQISKYWDEPISPYIRKRLEKGKSGIDTIKSNIKEHLKSEYDKNVPWWAMSNPFKSEIAIEDI